MVRSVSRRVCCGMARASCSQRVLGGVWHVACRDGLHVADPICVPVPACLRQAPGCAGSQRAWFGHSPRRPVVRAGACRGRSLSPSQAAHHGCRTLRARVPVSAPAPLPPSASWGTKGRPSGRPGLSPMGGAALSPHEGLVPRGAPLPARRRSLVSKVPGGDAKGVRAGGGAGTGASEMESGGEGIPLAFPSQRPGHREVSIYGKTQEGGSSRNPLREAG